jgi:hypothetical protein
LLEQARAKECCGVNPIHLTTNAWWGSSPQTEYSFTMHRALHKINRAEHCSSAQKRRNVEEYQHFDLVHKSTGKCVSVAIGPLPVHMRDFPVLMRKCMKDKGLRFEKGWDIKKAWVAPKAE